ncbi:MAG TPA: MFS transporter [Candidatus Aquilonibacter sp.]|nr:MFS transporter [Candidatus Aquilonibacter sp.]
MTPRKMKISCYTLEGLNSFATVLYFYYLYFFMQNRFGFDDKHNLAFASLLGFIYIFVAWQAGKFAQRRGYFNALKLGFGVMAVSLAAAWLLHSAVAQVLAASFVTLGMCFIWPTLEALVSDGETAADLPRAVGTYNVVWAATNAAAYFIGGALKHAFGYRIIFILPLGIVLLQLALTFWLQRHATELARAALNKPVTTPPPEPHRPASPQAKAFLRMAWLSNPFAYVAIQTLVAVMPGIAAKFQLSTMMAGFVCSLWCFVRFGAFAVLWHWTAWHYRFRWLAASFVLLTLSFATILIAPDLAALIVAQIFFGGAIGLIYYSSLFYSMDAGDTKGEHGGLHEAAIGIGNCVGPAIGALSLQFLPGVPDSGAIAVSVLLLCGFGGLLAIWKTAR